MTIDLLKLGASLEEIEGSVVFPPKYLPPAPSVINSWRYLMGALHPSIVKHQTYLANIPQAVCPPFNRPLGTDCQRSKTLLHNPSHAYSSNITKLEKLPCVDDVIKMT